MLAKLQLQNARVVERDSRFTIVAEGEGRTFRLHLTNTGRLNDLIYPNSEILYMSLASGRKVLGRVVGVSLGGSAALIDTILQARTFERALELGLVPWLQGYQVKKREVVRCGCRFDYLLSGVDEVILELKSAVYLSGDGAAMYPDAISDRGVRQFKALCKLRSSGENTGVVFIAAHPYATHFKPNFDIDPNLRSALCEALKLNVLIKSIKIHLELDGAVVLDDPDFPMELPC